MLEIGKSTLPSILPYLALYHNLADLRHDFFCHFEIQLQPQTIGPRQQKKHWFSLTLKNSFLAIYQNLSQTSKGPNFALPKTTFTQHFELVFISIPQLEGHFPWLFFFTFLPWQSSSRPFPTFPSQTLSFIHHWKAYGASVLGQQHQTTTVPQLSIKFGKNSISLFCEINTCFKKVS